MSFTWGPLSGGSHLLLTPAAGGSTGSHYYRWLLRQANSMFFIQSSGTAAYRRFPLYLVDATDGITAETGEAAGQPQISKNGAAFANTTATLTAIGNGAYYVELTTTELNTLGVITVRYKSAATAEFSMSARVILADLFDFPLVTTTGMSQPVADLISDTVWDELRSAHTAGGSFGQGAASVQGNITGSVASVTAVSTGAITTTSFAAGAINAAAIATDAIGAAELAADAVAEIADAIWDEARSGHVGAGSFGEGVASVTGSVGSVATGGITAGSIAADAIGASELAADAIAEIADAVWDEAIAGHLGAGSTGAVLNSASAPTAAAVADAVWDEAIGDHLTGGSSGATLAALPTASGIDSTLTSSHGTGSWVDAGGLTAAAVADAVWDELSADHVTTGTMGKNLQTLASAVLIWPTPVGGGIAGSTLITRAKAIADVHDNFVTDTEWIVWLNQEQYALRLFLARSGWNLPFDTTAATITSTGWNLSTNGGASTPVATSAGHYVFTPSLADVMAIVSIHESQSGGLKRLEYSNAIDFLRQLNGSTLNTTHATEFRLRMYGNEVHVDFYPTPATGEVYLISYLSAPTPLTAVTQSVALPMGWEERIVLGMARRALIKEESDPTKIESLIAEMDSQIEQLCWSRVMGQAPKVRNTDPVSPTIPTWEQWYWL